MKKVRVQQS